MTASWPRFTLLLAIALATALWPSVFGGEVLLPLDLLSHNPPHTPPEGAGPVHNPLIGDMLYENLMWKVFQRRAIADGDLPLWNPYSFCGHPLYTTGQASTFYPLNAIFWIMPPARAYIIFIGLHLLLGGLFTYLLLRRLGVGDFGATVGGFMFAMGGFLVCRLVFPMLLASAIWLPLMLLWLERESRRVGKRLAKGGDQGHDGPTGSGESAPSADPSASLPTSPPPTPRQSLTGSLAWGAPLFALPLLGGFFEIAFYAFAACGLFALVHCVRLLIRERAPAATLRYAATAALIVVLAVVLATPQLLPFFEVMKLNVRAGEGTWEMARGSALQAHELLPAIIPDALGNPTVHHTFDLTTRTFEPIDGGRGSIYFGPKNYVEIGSYLGVLPVLFALIGLCSPGRAKGFFALLLVVALGMAFVTPLYRLFFHFVPGAEQVRTPFRWLFLVCFAVTYFAAVGAQRWYDRLRDPSTRTGRLSTALLSGVALLIAAGTIVLLFAPGPLIAIARFSAERSRPVQAGFGDADRFAGFLWVQGVRLAIFLLGAALILALGAWRAWRARAAGLIALAAVAFIAVDLAQASFSFNTHSDPALLTRIPPEIDYLQRDSGLFRIGRYGPDKFLYANLPTLYGLQDFGGYDSIILSSYARFLGAIELQHLLRYNIVMTLERPGSLDSPLLPLLNIRYLLTAGTIQHPDWERVPVAGSVGLYRIRPERELPRAFLVSRVRPAASLDEAVALIRSGQVDLRQEAVVEAAPETAASLVDAGGTGTGATATITEYRPNRVTIRTRSDRRALLVLCDVFYPGWNVYVDDVPGQVLATNGCFRGVSVPAGLHTVTFRFEPRMLRIGVALSLACLLILVAAALASCWRTRAVPSGDQDSVV